MVVIGKPLKNRTCKFGVLDENWKTAFFELVCLFGIVAVFDAEQPLLTKLPHSVATCSISLAIRSAFLILSAVNFL